MYIYWCLIGFTMVIYKFINVLLFFVWNTSGIMSTSVCQEGAVSQVAYVCSESKTTVSSNTVFLDTSTTPDFGTTLCICRIRVTKQKGSLLPYTTSLSTDAGYVVTEDSFIISDIFGRTFNPVFNGIDSSATVKMPEQGLVITYRHQKEKSYGGCLKISVQEPDVEIKASCNGTVPSVGFVPILSTSTPSLITTNQDINNNDNRTAAQDDNLAVPIGAGVGGFTLLVLVTLVVFIIIKRRHAQSDTKDDNEDMQTVNPMYNNVIHFANSSGTNPLKGPYYTKSKVKQSAPKTHVTIVEDGVNDDTQYAEPHDNFHHVIGPNGDVYSKPIKTIITNKTSEDKSLPNVTRNTYSSVSKPSVIMHHSFSNPHSDPTAVYSQKYSGDNLYDHTWDKEPAVPMNEYSHLKKVQKRQQDALNTYDTAVNVNNRFDMTTEDMYGEQYDTTHSC